MLAAGAELAFSAWTGGQCGLIRAVSSDIQGEGRGIAGPWDEFIVPMTQYVIVFCAIYPIICTNNS
jgi:hypothetical protein